MNTDVVIGEDVHLLILLTTRTPVDTIIYFLKPRKAQVQTKMYLSQSLTAYLKYQAHILCLHAMTDCDNAFALFKTSKISVLKLCKKRKALLDCPEVFKKIDFPPQIIIIN